MLTDEQEYELWLAQQEDVSDDEYDATMSAIYDNYVAIYEPQRIEA